MRFVLQAVVGGVTLTMFGSMPVGAAQASAPVPVAATQGRWLVDQPARAVDLKEAAFGGRPALWLRNNTAAVRAGPAFLDGTIEFDVAPMDQADFFGVEFRRQGYGLQENVYFRVGDSSRFNALQYAPRINRSSTWQLYPEFNATAAVPRNQWTHVKMDVAGSGLTIYLNGDPKPVLTVDRLRGQFGEGGVAFWARVTGKPGEWAAAVANITVTPRPSTGARNPPPAPSAPGTLREWQVADPVRADSLPIRVLPLQTGWRPVAVEEGGLVNLNRLLGPLSGRWTAIARTTLRAAAAVTVPLDLGFSDEVVVFLNGHPVYEGRNGWESRYPGYLGFVQRGYEAIYLTLTPGRNELVLAVTDDMRFGWGFSARIAPDAPIDVIR